MRLNQKIPILILCTSIFIIGCKKKDNPIPVGVTAKFSYEAGSSEHFIARTFHATWYTASVTPLYISASSGAHGGDYLDLTIMNFENSPGTYDIGKKECDIHYGFPAVVHVDFSALSGRITIIQVSDSNIIGSFYATLVDYDKITVTDGLFNVPRQ